MCWRVHVCLCLRLCHYRTGTCYGASTHTHISVCVCLHVHACARACVCACVCTCLCMCVFVYCATYEQKAEEERVAAHVTAGDAAVKEVLSFCLGLYDANMSTHLVFFWRCLAAGNAAVKQVVCVCVCVYDIGISMCLSIYVSM